MGRFEKFGHYRTFTCGILVSWKTAGARAKPQPNSERPPGHENLAAFLFPYHGPGHRTAGAFLLSPCPRRIVHERGGLAQTSLSPGSSMPRVAQGLPCGFTAPSPLWVLPGKRRIAGQVKSDYFSQKIKNFQGCFVTLFQKAGKPYPLKGVSGGKGMKKTRNRPRRTSEIRQDGANRASGTKGGAAGGGEKRGRKGQNRGGQ